MAKYSQLSLQAEEVIIGNNFWVKISQIVLVAYAYILSLPHLICFLMMAFPVHLVIEYQTNPNSIAHYIEST